jgi:hypothetical protein
VEIMEIHYENLRRIDALDDIGFLGDIEFKEEYLEKLLKEYSLPWTVGYADETMTGCVLTSSNKKTIMFGPVYLLTFVARCANNIKDVLP